MKYAIIGSGNVGFALACIFARENIEVAIANSRGPETLASLKQELGPAVVPQSAQGACKAEIVFPAVPFPEDKDVAEQHNWIWDAPSLPQEPSLWSTAPALQAPPTLS